MNVPNTTLYPLQQRQIFSHLALHIYISSSVVSAICHVLPHATTRSVNTFQSEERPLSSFKMSSLHEARELV